MLRKILAGLALSVLVSASAQGQSAWVEGEHYEVIAEKASAKPQVKEVFSSLDKIRITWVRNITLITLGVVLFFLIENAFNFGTAAQQLLDEFLQ